MITKIPVLRTDHYNYNAWLTGKEVAASESKRCDYWHGCDAIRETPAYYYLLLTGTATYDGSSVFTHYVHRVAKSVLAGQDMQKLADNLTHFRLDWDFENLCFDDPDKD